MHNFLGYKERGSPFPTTHLPWWPLQMFTLRGVSMFAQTTMQVFRSVLAALLICSIFHGCSAVEENKVDASVLTAVEENKIDASVLAAARTQSTISVAIYLQDQPPSKQISDAVKAQFQPDIEAKSAEIRDRIRPFRRRNQALPAECQSGGEGDAGKP